jgi:Cysteine-rich secretory protein family
MNGKLSIIMSVILVTSAILTVQSSMLQPSYAQTRTQLDATAQNTILTMHNQERTAVRVPQVTWSDSLATDAQNWANYIVSLNLRWDICYDQVQDPRGLQCPPHVPRAQANGQGENLAWGYNTPLATHVQGWANEKRNYVPGTPIAQDLGYPNWYGHYTQMVWQSTTQIGCGIAKQTIGANTWDVLVCRYSPGGNWTGELPYNPQPPAAAMGEEQNTLGDQGAGAAGAAMGEEQNTLGDQGAGAAGAAMGEEQNTLGDQGVFQ